MAYLPKEWEAKLRADHITHGRAATEILDRVETVLVRAYEEGAESAALQALFDQAIAIIKKTNVPANERFQEICKALRDFKE